MTDRENLFQKSHSNKKITSHVNKVIGITDALALAPLTYGLKRQPLPDNIRLNAGTLKENAKKLREGEIEIALISPLDYALSKETWHIVPGIGLASTGKAKHVQLFFKKDLKEIQTIAVDQNASGEDVLLKIVMREKYEQSPEYIYMPANMDTMLGQADAALIVGDAALSYYNDYPTRIDLNEEWLDLTGLPFVYALWMGRDMTVSKEDVKLIQTSYHLGINNLQHIAREYASEKEENWSFYFDYINHELNFSFAEHEEDGLLEFLNYAFFYGHTEYIPDLHFFKS